MSALRTPPGRPSGAMDHVIAGAGCLAAAAAAGAVLTLTAQGLETFLGLAVNGIGLLALLWVFGAGFMAVPMNALLMVPLGAALLLLARRGGLGGWLSALVIGAALTWLRFAGAPVLSLDAAYVLVLGMATAWAYWAILTWRLREKDDISRV